MKYDELIKKYLEDGYTEEEAETKAKQDIEEQEQLDWLRYQQHINKRPWLSQKD